ncbi:MAG: hypothetical protein ACLP7A_13835 [Desulfobaccales bacterium]
MNYSRVLYWRIIKDLPQARGVSGENCEIFTIFTAVVSEFQLQQKEKEIFWGEDAKPGEPFLGAAPKPVRLVADGPLQEAGLRVIRSGLAGE